MTAFFCLGLEVEHAGAVDVLDRVEGGLLADEGGEGRLGGPGGGLGLAGGLVGRGGGLDVDGELLRVQLGLVARRPRSALRAVRSVIAMLRAYSRICSRDPTARALSALGVSQYQLIVGHRKAKATAMTASTINNL